MVIVEIIIMNFVGVKKKENLDMINMGNNVLAANNILKFALNPKNKSGQVLSDEPMETLALVRSVK